MPLLESHPIFALQESKLKGSGNRRGEALPES